MTPSYIALHERGELANRVARASEILAACSICPRRCYVDRTKGELGVCRTGAAAEVASVGPHFGEESPLVGDKGSGTIFFSSCNLRCVFCQNYDISQQERGRLLSPQALGRLMVNLQVQGCHNINLVTPTHQVPAILAGLLHAVELGLSIPLVYNSSGYESLETLRLLDGIVDIYMPDLKTLDAHAAERYLRAPDYPDVVRCALREMHRQVGDLVIDSRGIARCGLLLRHLVMPGDRATTVRAMAFVGQAISKQTYVNLMDQWHPAGETGRFPEIDRRITAREYREALESAERAGLRRLDPCLPRHLPGSG